MRMKDDKDGKAERSWRGVAAGIAFYAVFVIALGWVAYTLWSGSNERETISYSRFHALVEKGDVSDLIIGASTITGMYRLPGKKPAYRSFSTVRVDPKIADELNSRKINFTGEQESSGAFVSVLGWLVPFVGMALLWYVLLRPSAGSATGGLLGIGRSRARVFAEHDVGVTFADVAGVDEAKQELAEVVGFLKNPEYYGRLGARVPKGVLLVGPPGTGKTLLARAVAGEAGVPFFSITGSEFVEMFVGVGAARVRDLFAQARQSAPSIVFIDELDALGRARGVDLPTGGHEEKEQTLNQLLAEMDGFDSRSGCIVLAATNRPEILDPALLRAGRFDRQVLVDRPDRKGRTDILRVHLKKITIDTNLDVDAIAALTPGFTGADLANLVNEAALVATRRSAATTMLEDFNQAIERIVAGLEKKSRILTKREREIVAHHEMGHALVAMALPGTDPVQKVSIIPRGLSALGYTLQRPTDDRFIQSREELQNRLSILLGGRAAESVMFSDVSTGAADDLARATDIARDMVTRFGMTKALGQVAYEPERTSFLVGQTPMWRQRLYGEHAADEIDQTIKDLVEHGFARASAILRTNRGVLERGARKLLELETLDASELATLRAELAVDITPRAALSAVS